MVQKKTAEIQGFHHSFKVRAGSVWGLSGAGPPEWPVREWGRRGARPQDPLGFVPDPHFVPGAAPAVPPAPWGLWGLSSWNHRRKGAPCLRVPFKP